MKTTLEIKNGVEAADDDTLAVLYEFFGKGVVQLLRKVVAQQVTIDELRAQTRSLQTQITNINTSIDEMEDRILIKIQNNQPTIYTREGIPIDDALDALTSKLNNTVEKLNTTSDGVERFESEIAQKVDKEEFDPVKQESAKTAEEFTNLNLTFITLQKELQKFRDEANEQQDKIIDQFRKQIESLSNQNDSLDDDKFSNYVTKDELNERLSQLKMSGGAGSGSSDADYDIIEWVLSGEGPTQEKIQQAFEVLRQRQENVDGKYKGDRAKIESDYQKLLKIAKKLNPEGSEDEGEEVETDSNDNQSEKSAEEKPKTPGQEEDGKDQQRGDATSPKSQDSSGKKSKPKKVTSIAKPIPPFQQLPSGPSRPPASINEGKLAQSVFQLILPRLEAIINETLAKSKSQEIALDKNEAKTILDQLQQLEQIKIDLKTLKLKLQLKLDKGKAEQEFSIRVTRDELYNILHQLFPDNPNFDRLSTQAPGQSRAYPSNQYGRKSREGLGHSTVLPKIRKPQSPPHLVPMRASKFFVMNQKYLRGADGRYYFKDLGIEQNSETASIFGREKVDLEAAFDFIQYRDSQQGSQEDPNESKDVRGFTPNDQLT